MIFLSNRSIQENHLYDKLGYKIISLPIFNKGFEELKTVMDQWLYRLKRLIIMNRLATFLDKRIFGLIFKAGEIGKLQHEELMSYEASLKHKRDTESVFNSARKSGRAEGLAEGRVKGLAEGRVKALAEGKRKATIAIALKLKKMGHPIADIAKSTGLSAEELEKL